MVRPSVRCLLSDSEANLQAFIRRTLDGRAKRCTGFSYGDRISMTRRLMAEYYRAAIVASHLRYEGCQVHSQGAP
jgi:hypothetical protein